MNITFGLGLSGGGEPVIRYLYSDALSVSINSDAISVAVQDEGVVIDIEAVALAVDVTSGDGIALDLDDGEVVVTLGG